MKQINIRNYFFNIFGLFALVLVLAACGAAADGNSKEIKIGYQKNGTTLSMKNSKAFKNDFEELGYKVTWSEFNTGSSILEALNAGSIDFAGAGDIPSLFALDKGGSFKYIGSEPDGPTSEGILVGKDSGIDSLEKLKGKKVAFNNASIAQYLLTKSLESVGLTIDDIEVVHLTPPDASIAFGKGDVDAWVVWDPYLAVAESQGNVVLQTAEGLVPYRSFYFSTAEMTDEHPELVKTFVEHLGQIGKDIDNDPEKAARLMEEETKIAAETWEVILKRKNSRIKYIEEDAVRDLQTQVKDLLEIGLIENDMNVKESIWYPESK
ncbi:aliphatic sulfonate ABC transporter substrate-binding protein [bacterium LRH843]|nr:aliphatic sulfonate ABC transporter substrate-binding protein [bacterium LRH843]